MTHKTILKTLSLLWLSVFLSYNNNAQCDVSITGVDVNTYEVTVEVINSTGCTANGPGGVDGAVTMLQIGYHLPEPVDINNAVVDLATLPDGPCSPQWVANGYNLGMVDGNYSGWWYSPSVSVTFDSDLMGDGLETGDEVVISLNPPGDYVTYPYPLAECGDDLIDYWLSEDECIEFVVWQLNYGSTWHTANGGWAESLNGYVPNPMTYQDPNCNNSWYMCRDENPGPAVANSDNECLPIGPDAEVINVVITTGCIGDVPFYNIEYVVYNNGNEEITEYCIELWNEDYYICFDSELFGAYAIPPGEGQTFTSPFFEMDGPGSLFVISVDSVNDEIITGNNNETVWLPEIPECPVECLSDTVEIFTTLYEFDTLYVATYDTIVEYVELPQDTLVLLETDTLIEYVELPPDTVVVLQLDTVYIPWEYYFYDTVYVDVFDTIYVNVLDTVIITEIDIEYVYVTDTLEVPVVDTLYITQVDTLMQEVVVYEYIYQTDTIYDVVYNEVLVDCTTGLPCGDGFTGNDCRSVFVPNAFSPNNDGINDTFYAVSESYTCWLDWSLVVYNRWGNVVWFTDDPDVQWYGQVVDGMASDGVYVWTLIAKGVDGNTLSLDGTVTVFR